MDEEIKRQEETDEKLEEFGIDLDDGSMLDDDENEEPFDLI